MITDCVGGGTVRYFIGLDERAFFVDVLILIVVATPVTIGYILWRIFVSNRASFRVSAILRLDENSETCSDSGRRIPWLTVFIYTLTAGVFVFEALLYVQSLLT